MKNKRLHINRILSVLLLWVFAIALIPWDALHHHEEQQNYCSLDGKMCMHKAHIGNERHNCVICATHFIKDYYPPAVSFQIKLESKPTLKGDVLVTTTYTALISTSLRGPPAV